MTRHFTESELQEVLAYYRSSAGKKSLTLMPQMMQEMMAWIPTVIGSFQNRIRERVNEALKAKGYDL